MQGGMQRKRAGSAMAAAFEAPGDTCTDMAGGVGAGIGMGSLMRGDGRFVGEREEGRGCGRVLEAAAKIEQLLPSPE
jgi:hypothetical protein